MKEANNPTIQPNTRFNGVDHVQSSIGIEETQRHTRMLVPIQNASKSANLPEECQHPDERRIEQHNHPNVQESHGEQRAMVAKRAGATTAPASANAIRHKPPPGLYNLYV